MRRFAIFLATFSLGALIPALPASAANGAPGASGGSCSTGSTCQVQLGQWISVNGSSASSTPTFNNTVDITPPPCLWEPIGDAITGSNAIIGVWGKNPAKAPANFQINQSVQQADDLLKAPAPGEWYELPVNPNATAAGQAECLKLPLYAWVPPNQVPPGVDIPPQTLAQVAFASVETPTVNGIQTNPTGNSETNLPTFVQATLADGGGLGITADGKHAYTWVTAQLKGGNEAATVWIMSNTLTLTTDSADATVYNDCGHTVQDGTNVTLGSGTPAAQMAQTQANQSIDCGVTYRAPGTFNLQVSVGWTACWAATADPAPPSYAECQGTPIPGAGNLNPRNATRQVAVNEIQSVNG
jgi:hypothetical protein